MSTQASMAKSQENSSSGGSVVLTSELLRYQIMLNTFFVKNLIIVVFTGLNPRVMRIYTLFKLCVEMW